MTGGNSDECGTVEEGKVVEYLALLKPQKVDLFENFSGLHDEEELTAVVRFFQPVL